MSNCGFHNEFSSGSSGPFQHVGNVPYPAYTPEYETFDIPGLGDAYEDCGKVFKVWFCGKCLYKKPIKNTCHRPVCSECWKTWASRETGSAIDRISGFKTAYKAFKGRRVGNPQHIILSPPQEEVKKTVLESGGIEKLRKMVHLILRSVGIRGGLVVFHPYRIKNEYKAALLVASKKEDKKFWSLVREDALGLGDWRLYVNLSPHFHVIGFGSRVNGGKVYEKTGWIYKFIRHISKEEDVSKAVYYLLTHTAVREGKRTVTWFGSLSYNKLSKKRVSVEYVAKRCPNCGADLLIEYLLTGLREEGLEKLVTWVYKMKPKPPPRQKILE